MMALASWSCLVVKNGRTNLHHYHVTSVQKLSFGRLIDVYNIVLFDDRDIMEGTCYCTRLESRIFIFGFAVAVGG